MRFHSNLAIFLLLFVAASHALGVVYITSQPPASIPLYAGDTFSLDTEVVTAGAAQFQWLRNGREVAGATSADLPAAVFDPVQHAGVWVLRVTDVNGTRFSQRSLVARAAWLKSWRGTGSALLTLGSRADVLSFSSGDPHWVILGDSRMAGVEEPAGYGFSFNAGPAIPSSLAGVVQAAARGNRCVALRADGGVTSWESVPAGGIVLIGTMTAQLSSVPASAQQDVLGVSLGGTQAVAVKTDGSVVVWDVVTGALLAPLAGLSNVAQVRSGPDHHLALRADGTVTAWGDNAEGECQVPAGLVDVIEVAAGDHFSLALKSDGSVTAWGRNAEGQCNVPAGLNTVRTISASGGLAMAVKADGSLVIWGSGDPGMLDLTTVVAGTRPLIAAAVHRRTSLYLSAGAGLVPNERLIFTQQPQSQTVLTGFGTRFVARVTGLPSVLSVEWYRNGQFVGYGSSDSTPGSYTLNLPSGLTSADAGDYTLQVSNGIQTVTSQPATLTVLTAPTISSQPLNQNVVLNTTVTLTADTTSAQPLEWQWYRNGLAIPGAAGSSHTFTATAETAGRYQVRVRHDTEGYQFSNAAFVRILSTYREWGTRNRHPDAAVVETALGTYSGLYLLPDGTVRNAGSSWTPTIYASDNANILAVFARGKRLAVLTRTNRVIEWQAFASLNSWELAYRPLYTQMEGQPYVQLALGERHTLALRQDGSLTAWAFTTAYGPPNEFGVLDIPASLTDIAQITAGKDHSVALRRDGTVVAWGRNDLGQCNVPAGLDQVVQIAANQNYTLALKSNGTLIAWGSLHTPPAPAPAIPEDAPLENPAPETEDSVTSRSTIIIINPPPQHQPRLVQRLHGIRPRPASLALQPPAHPHFSRRRALLRSAGGWQRPHLGRFRALRTAFRHGSRLRRGRRWRLPGRPPTIHSPGHHRVQRCQRRPEWHLPKRVFRGSEGDRILCGPPHLCLETWQRGRV